MTIEADKTRVQKIIDVPFDPVLRGMENDRVRRAESYVKDFKKLVFPTIKLNKGSYNLKLKKRSSSEKGEINIKRILLTS